MGVFYTQCIVSNPGRRERAVKLRKVLVDTGSECTWILGRLLEEIGIKREKKDLQFVMANGKTITRSIGYAIIQAGEFTTVDEVVFAERGDLQLLGARSLEGMNAVPDPRRKRLVAGGPILAA